MKNRIKEKEGKDKKGKVNKTDMKSYKINVSI
jgi:hypothetical protein